MCPASLTNRPTNLPVFTPLKNNQNKMVDQCQLSLIVLQIAKNKLAPLQERTTLNI